MASKQAKAPVQIQATAPSGKAVSQYKPPVVNDSESNSVIEKLQHVSMAWGLIWYLSLLIPDL